MLIILRSLRGKYSPCNRFQREDGFNASIRSPYFVVRLLVFSLNLAVGEKLTQKMVPGPLSLSLSSSLSLSQNEGRARSLSPYVAHHDVDKGVLNQREEHEKGARGHEHVNRLYNNDDYDDLQR